MALLTHTHTREQKNNNHPFKNLNSPLTDDIPLLALHGAANLKAISIQMMPAPPTGPDPTTYDPVHTPFWQHTHIGPMIPTVSRADHIDDQYSNTSFTDACQCLLNKQEPVHLQPQCSSVQHLNKDWSCFKAAQSKSILQDIPLEFLLKDRSL